MPPRRSSLDPHAPEARRDEAAARPPRRERFRPVALGVAIAAIGMLVRPSYALAAEIVHVVAKGQTLKGIAKRYRTQVDALRAVNNLKPGERIHPGLVLVIPEKGKEGEAAKKAAELRAEDERQRDKERGAKTGARGLSKEAPDKPSAHPARGTAEVAFAAKPKRPGRVRFVRGTEHVDVQLLSRHGRLVPAALATVGKMLRFYPTGAKIPIDPRLATLIGMVSDHFGGRPLHVVSGFRPYSPRQYTPHSNHNVGRAFDFSVDGVPNTVVRDFCRTIHAAGVGYYPNSSFVHLDVRTEKAYWIDYSHAGEAPRYSSPVEQAAADESASEVDDTGSAQPAAGSHGTLHPTEQAGESSKGNLGTPDDPSDSAVKRGADDPPRAP
jgi:uncharacterized protein YcbK (DUF882 family)